MICLVWQRRLVFQVVSWLESFQMEAGDGWWGMVGGGKAVNQMVEWLVKLTGELIGIQLYVIEPWFGFSIWGFLCQWKAMRRGTRDGNWRNGSESFCCQRLLDQSCRCCSQHFHYARIIRKWLERTTRVCLNNGPEMPAPFPSSLTFPLHWRLFSSMGIENVSICFDWRTACLLASLFCFPCLIVSACSRV